MPVNSLDEMAQSAICELGNMIMGRVSTAFAQQGLRTDITTPTLLQGDNIKLTSPHGYFLSIKFLSGEDEIYFDISIKQMI